MAQEYELKEVRRQISYAWSSIPHGFGWTKRDFENARDRNTDAVKNVEKAMNYHKGRGQTESCSEWQDLLCEASFGKGLAEGLQEMKNKTYRNRHRSFRELGAVVEELNIAYLDMARGPKLPENHSRVGNGFGRLGLAKETKNMLETGDYWDNIKDYLSKK